MNNDCNKTNLSQTELKQIKEIFDGRYVLKSDCQLTTDDLTNLINKDNVRLALIEHQQKINNWLTLAIAGGIVALVIKVYLGG